MSAYDVLRNRGNFLHPSRITRCVSPPPGLLQNKSYKNYKRIIAFLVSIQDDYPRLYFTRLPTLITIRAPTPSLCQNLLDDSFRVFLRGCPTTKVTSDRLALRNCLIAMAKQSAHTSIRTDRITHRQRSLLNLISVLVEIHVPARNASANIAQCRRPRDQRTAAS